MERPVRLRPYELRDAPFAFEAVRESMAALRPWMPWCHPGYSIEETRSWIKTQVAAFENRVAFEFAITSADGHYLGGCGLNQIDAANQRANLGYWVRSSAAGRGVATAAVGLLRDWGFCNTDLLRLEIVVATGNAASQRVAQKAGAIREGTLRSRLLLHGRSHDAAMYSLTRGEGGDRGRDTCADDRAAATDRKPDASGKSLEAPRARNPWSRPRC